MPLPVPPAQRRVKAVGHPSAVGRGQRRGSGGKQGSRLHHCIPRMQLGYGVQQGQMGYRAHRCSPNLPQLRGAEGRADNCAASPLTPTIVKRPVQTRLTSRRPGDSPSCRSCTTQGNGSTGVCCLYPPPQLAAVPVCARDVYTHGMEVPEPVCTHVHPAGKTITHVLTHPRHTRVHTEPLRQHGCRAACERLRLGRSPRTDRTGRGQTPRNGFEPPRPVFCCLPGVSREPTALGSLALP